MRYLSRKRGHLAVAQRVNHVVGEALAGDIADGLFRRAQLDLVPDGLHQVGLAHADSAVQEQRVVGLGRPLAHRARRGMGKLIARTDDEVVERVLRIQLRRSIPIETLLGDGTRSGLVGDGQRIVSRFGGARRPGIVPLLFVGYELHVLKLEAEIFDGLTDQVAVAFADLAELRIGDAHEQNRTLRVIVARGLEPGFVGTAIDFFLQCVENPHPRIGGGSTKGRHQ